MEFLGAIDRTFFLYLNSFHTEWLNPVMVFLSGQAVWAPLIGCVLYLAWRKLTASQFWIFLLFLVLTLIASDVTSSYIIKNIFQRLRPCRIDELKILIYQFNQRCGGRFGFVSSHAANSLALITFSVVSLNLEVKKYWVLWLLPLIVGYSRIYLGVHYPGDILGGLVIGMGWSLVFATFFKSNIYGASRNFSQP